MKHYQVWQTWISRTRSLLCFTWNISQDWMKTLMFHVEQSGIPLCACRTLSFQCFTWNILVEQVDSAQTTTGLASVWRSHFCST